MQRKEGKLDDQLLSKLSNQIMGTRQKYQAQIYPREQSMKQLKIIETKHVHKQLNQQRLSLFFSGPLLNYSYSFYKYFIKMQKLWQSQVGQNTHFQGKENIFPLTDGLEKETNSKKQKSNIRINKNINFELSSFENENSFDFQGNQHPSTINTHFQKYIQKILNGKQPKIYISAKRFKSELEFYQNEQLQKLQDLLNNLKFTNEILNQQEENQFNRQLSRGSLIAKTIFQLFMDFQKDLFLEFYEVILIIWKRFYQFARESCSEKFQLKQLNSLLKINSISSNIKEEDTTLPFTQISYLSILQEASRSLPPILNQLHNNSHLKLLKIENYGMQVPSNDKLKQFSAFIQILIKSVFLSSLEIYQHPNSQRQTKKYRQEVQFSYFNCIFAPNKNQLMQTESDSSFDYD